ncbi:MAG: hypothetical protein IPJ98_26445 [Bryobacterales bacterium]|nr:hypothetical protein [Bryobacterales bacterium]
MRITRLDVANFRGIRTLSWSPQPTLNCLIGAGDATKSTILAAMEIVLWPSWNLSIDETDCHELTTQNPITIAATIADPPAELLREDVFCFLQRGWSAAGELHDEPAPEDVPALTIRFTLNSDNEPVWHVIADHHPHEKTISARQRALCNMTRVDTIDRQLTWTNGSLPDQRQRPIRTAPPRRLPARRKRRATRFEQKTTHNSQRPPIPSRPPP